VGFFNVSNCEYSDVFQSDGVVFHPPNNSCHNQGLSFFICADWTNDFSSAVNWLIFFHIISLDNQTSQVPRDLRYVLTVALPRLCVITIS